MEIFVYRKDAARVEEGFAANDLPALLADDGNLVWIDFYTKTDDDRKKTEDIMLNVFKFHHLTVEDCFETRNQPKVEEFPDYLYIIVHGVKPEETGSANFITRELDCFLGKNFVVTHRVERFKSIKSVKQKIRSFPNVCKRGADYLLHQILDEMVDLYFPVVEDFDEAVAALEDRIFHTETSNNRISEEILDLKRNVVRLRRITSKQLDVLYRISRGEFPLIDEAHLPFYRDVYDHLQRVVERSENYREMIGGLFDIQFNVVSNRTNEIVKFLTIFSAIWLPLSFIAGVYGMNFDNMPELKTRNGYFVVLAVMVAIVVLLLFYFWRKGWIFQKDEEEE